MLVLGVSVIALFIELALIRWLPAQVRALSYFKNIVLISSFLGFGLGFILKTRMRFWTTTLPLWLLLEIVVALLLGQFRIIGTENPDEHLWLLYSDLPRTAPLFPLALALPLAFILNTCSFIGFGQILARTMQDVNDSLLAYIANLLGSILGTLLFVAISFAELNPYVWFVPALVILGLLLWRETNMRNLAWLAAMVCLLLPLNKPDTIWSPYYALRAEPFGLLSEETSPSTQYDILVNGSFHQALLDFRPESRARSEFVAHAYESYLIPYQVYRAQNQRAPMNVLIVGAGTGNDVALALEEGASHIDAVEIDPAILRMGATLRGDHAYQDSRVALHVNDARSFLQNAPRQYDLIIFGTLDSQIALSALSTIRLDNYVYTVESFAQARRALKPDGMLALYFWSAQSWIRARLVGSVQKAFGYAPRVILNPQPVLFNTIVIAPNDSRQLGATTTPTVEPLPDAQLATDDWPFLYQRERALSTFYLAEIAILLALSLIAVRLSLWERLGAARVRPARFSVPLFFQGMAFLLIETRAISALALLFGSTWIVNAIVITTLLGLSLLANVFVRLTRWNDLKFPFVGLVVLLLASYLMPPQTLLLSDFFARTVVGSIVYLVPIFFSSVIFSILFRELDDVSWAMGSNLLGAVVGGFSEYASSIIGLNALNLLALALFIPVILVGRRGKTNEQKMNSDWSGKPTESDGK